MIKNRQIDSKIDMGWLYSLLPVMICTAALPPVYAADEEYCTDYVIVAISQYWQSVDDSCVFTNERWNSDYSGLYNWCLKTNQVIVQNEMESRDQMLEECRSNKKEKSDSEVGGKKVDSDKNNGMDEAGDKAGNKKISDHLSKDVAIALEIPSELDDSEDGGALTEANSVNEKPPIDSLLSLNKQLLRAVSNNNLEEVKALVNKGADIHFVTHDLSLINAFKMSYHLGKGVSINSGADVGSNQDASLQVTNNVVNKERQQDVPESESLVSYAVNKGLFEVGLWLIEQSGNDFDQATQQRLRNDLLGKALISAVKDKNMNVVLSLLDEGAPVDYDLEMNFGTPLYFAVTQGDVELARVLLEKGASPLYTTNGGQNMLNSVIGKDSLLELLLENGANPNDHGELSDLTHLPLLEAIKQGYVSSVDLLLKYGAKTDIFNTEESDPLLLAISGKQVEMVKVLIKYKVNVNVVYNSGLKGCARGKKNLSPLDKALGLGDQKIIDLLKKSGARTGEELCLNSQGGRI